MIFLLTNTRTPQTRCVSKTKFYLILAAFSFRLVHVSLRGLFVLSYYVITLLFLSVTLFHPGGGDIVDSGGGEKELE